RHSALLVVHLESPNLSPRALIGAFSGTTGPIGLVLTGPRAAKATLRIHTLFFVKYYSQFGINGLSPRLTGLQDVILDHRI
ncbi:MAG: hypothetical protein ABW118_18430, partial [Candidatus Thiodiazotropha sp.]